LRAILAIELPAPLIFLIAAVDGRETVMSAL